jgi:hypothetical protein
MELMRLLLQDGIPTRRGVMAIHEEVSYACAAVNLRHTEAATRDTMMLPLFADLSEQEQEYVIERLGKHTSRQFAVSPGRPQLRLPPSAETSAPVSARQVNCSEAP